MQYVNFHSLVNTVKLSCKNIQFFCDVTKTKTITYLANSSLAHHFTLKPNVLALGAFGMKYNTRKPLVKLHVIVVKINKSSTANKPLHYLMHTYYLPTEFDVLGIK